MDAVALAYAGLTLSTFGWAAGFIAGKFALAEMTPLSVAACRYAVAAAILLPFAVWQRPRDGVGRARGPLALMILAGGVLYPWLFLLALEHTTATNTALLIALNPVFTLFLVPLVGERVDRRRFIGVALALTGAAIVITRGDLAHVRALAFQTGDLLALVAAAMWATFNVASRSVVHQLSPSFTNCVIYGVGGFALYLLGRSEAPLAQFVAATPSAVGGILIMALLSSVMAGQLFLVGVRTVGVSRTVVFVYLVPVLTAGLSAVLLGEQLQVAQAVGGAAVLAGVYGTTRTT
jgi:drug/metabolite transporter (DMT)-like permease